MTILDPAACNPDEPYLVTLRNGRTTVGMRLDSNGEHQWLVPFQGNLLWCDDAQIAELHRLVPEAKDAALEALIEKAAWEIDDLLYGKEVARHHAARNIVKRLARAGLLAEAVTE